MILRYLRLVGNKNDKKATLTDLAVVKDLVKGIWVRFRKANLSK